MYQSVKDDMLEGMSVPRYYWLDVTLSPRPTICIGIYEPCFTQCVRLISRAFERGAYTGAFETNISNGLGYDAIGVVKETVGEYRIVEFPISRESRDACIHTLSILFSTLNSLPNVFKKLYDEDFVGDARSEQLLLIECLYDPDRLVSCAPIGGYVSATLVDRIDELCSDPTFGMRIANVCEVAYRSLVNVSCEVPLFGVHQHGPGSFMLDYGSNSGVRFDEPYRRKPGGGLRIGDQNMDSASLSLAFLVGLSLLYAQVRVVIDDS